MSMGPYLWSQDPWGRILNGALMSTELPVNVLTLAESAIDLAHERFADDLHSVYLTGPVARNQGREPEFIIVLRHSTQALGIDLFCAAAALRLQKEHPDFGTCHIQVYAWTDIFPEDGCFSYPRFRIGVNSVVVAGRDLKRLIAPQKLTTAVANAFLVDLPGKLSSLQQRLKAISTETRVHATSRLFSQTALDGAFALVLAEEQIYTEDPETMASFVGLSFPQHRNNLAALVRMSRLGTFSSLEALAVADETLRWLPGLAEAWLDQFNPERQKSLKLV